MISDKERNCLTVKICCEDNTMYLHRESTAYHGNCILREYFAKKQKSPLNIKRMMQKGNGLFRLWPI